MADSANSTRVIVVGNDVPTLIEVGRALSSLGYDGLPVVDAANARNMARLAGRLAMVIADEHLSDGSGVELAVELRRAYGCATAIIGEGPQPEEGCPAGIDLWLQRPLADTELRQAVRALSRMNRGGA